MGHQHIYSPHYMLETENDQSWNLADHTYMHTARNGTGESSSMIYPPDNMSIDGAQYTQISNCYSSLPHNMQIPNYQHGVAGPSNLSMHTSISPEDYRNQASSSSSSNYTGNPFNEEDLFDIRVGNGRVQYKRKSPGIPDASRGGSSADASMLTGPWQETPTTNFLQAPWDYGPTNPNGLSIGGENSVRNVRSRSGFDLETGSSRANLVNNLPREYYTTSRAMDVSLSPTVDPNPARLSYVAHGQTSGYELNPFLEGSSNPSNSAVMGQQNNIPTTSSHSLGHSVRGVRSNYGQRAGSTFRVSSTNLRLGDTSVNDEGLQLATNNYSSRHLRPSSTRARMSNDRYRSFYGVNFQNRPSPEGVMIMERTGFYGSRNPFDQHRDMRLDIDDMSYEELLALGERIGSVGTGVPEDVISKCLQESIYCCSDEVEEEGRCVICLEEYGNMDDVGTLRLCGHDFHGGCIRKWLSMKNMCPICKAEPMKHK